MPPNSLILLRAWPCLTLLAFTGFACSEDDKPPVRSAQSEPMGQCSAVTSEYVLDSAFHVPDCAPLASGSHPPPGGDHYQSWAAFQTYDFPIPVGYLMHSLEHGAVVLLYNCDPACPEEVQEAQDFIEALPEDPRCAGSGARRRAILAPDPELPVRWAASAWGHTLEAACFDTQTFETFYSLRVGNGPEDICNAGLAFTSPPCP